MAATPSVLFVSCSNTRPDDLIKLFLNVDTLPDRVHVEEDIHAYPWFIDNKYYTANVNLCPFPEKRIASKKFAETVQGVVLHFDSSEVNVLDKVETWLPFINEYDPEIKILVADSVPGEEDTPGKTCTRKSVLEWCIGKGFELVELEPSPEEGGDGDGDDSQDDDDFPETTGVQRIIQALNAHVWPNLVMKSSTTRVPKVTDSVRKELSGLREQLGFEESLDELLGHDNDDFVELFSRLSEMKEKVSTLSGTDKTDAAEQVVKAFWKALGGDDDEFLDM